MSDIKYIIAGDDGEQYTRFPCLAMVRYAMAAAVTMLAIAVIALVIHAVLRSEDVRLSVNNGYIRADSLWSCTSQNQSISPNKVVEPELSRAAMPAYSSETKNQKPASSILTDFGGLSGLPKEGALDCNLGGEDENHQSTSEVTLQKSNTTNLRVILIANNPGGRTKIDCNGTKVSVFDMQSPGGLIGTMDLDNFTVPPQTTITLQKVLKNIDTSYIWKNYRGEERFSVKVQVNASVTSYPLGKPTQPKPQSYVCQPVTVGLIGVEAIYATDHIDCRALAIMSAQLAPAPAPAP